jgi:cation diffusion facilitator family transporter
MPKGETKLVIYAALGANLLIALAKFLAAFFTHSSAMLAEAFHSVADSANQLFLLLGLKLAAKPPDAKHHFGHAHERYFWAFVVAICIFTVGAAVSIYEGAHKIANFRDPTQGLEHPFWGIAVLGVSVLLEAASWITAWREFRHLKGRRSIGHAISETRDPVILTVLLEDSAALFGLFAALGGLILAWLTQNMIYDGLASILVGCVLGTVAFIIARESKDLLLGESMTHRDAKKVHDIVESNPYVQKLITHRSMHLGPEEVLAALKIDFVDNLCTDEIESAIDVIEAELRRELPFLTRIYIEPGKESHSAQPPERRALPDK